MTARRATLVAVVVVALGTSGCAWVRQVTRPVPGSGVNVGRPAVTADGRYVVFAAHSDAAFPGAIDACYLRDTKLATTELVSRRNNGTVSVGVCLGPVVSDDGRYVAFSSLGDDLVANDTNGSEDVFRRDRTAGTTTRVSVTATGQEVEDASYEPSISGDGNVVAFASESDGFATTDSNLEIDYYVKTLATGAVAHASVGPSWLETDFGAWDGTLSRDGKIFAFTTDTDLVSLDENWSDDVYRRDLSAKTTKWISRPKVQNEDFDGGGGDSPSMSADGRYIAFVGYTDDIDTIVDPFFGADVYLRDNTLNTTVRISLAANGTALNGSSFSPAVSATGTRVAFVTTGNPTGADTNGTTSDLVVRDTVWNHTMLVSTKMFGDQLPFDVSRAMLTGDGRYALWGSLGQYDGDENNLDDYFIAAVDVPTVSSMSPATAARGATIPVTITGKGFLAGETLMLPQGVTGGAVTVVSQTTITVSISVAANAPTGPKDIFVVSPPTGPGVNTGAVGRCTNCLTIT